MGFYEQKRDVLVVKQLAKYGMDMYLKSTTGIVFDAETGGSTGGTERSTLVRGLKYPVSRRGKDEIGKDVLDVYLSASGLTDVPTLSHRLQVGSKTYDITDIEPLEPGGVVVMYQLRVRVP